MCHVLNKAMRSPGGLDCFAMTRPRGFGMSPTHGTGFNTKRSAMAQKKEEDAYMYWTHSENGRTLHRRIYELHIIDRFGRPHRIKGRWLPKAIFTYCGQAYVGEHLAEILLRPESIPDYPLAPPETAGWPTFRDVVNMFIGFMIVVMLRFIIGLSEAM